MCSVKCAGVQCGARSMKCEVWSEVRTVIWQLWGVKCAVSGVQCEVWSML